MVINSDSLIELEELALGSRLKRLSDQLMREASTIYEHLAIDFDPYHMPIFKLIGEKGELTIGEISNALKVTQPAVTQYVNALVAKNFVYSKVGKNDKRKRIISLTSLGSTLILKLKPVWALIDQELKTLTHQPENSSLLDHVTYVERELNQKSFSKIVLTKLEQNIASKMEIISFRKEYAHHFRDMNLAWLKKYFYVEEHDKDVLNNAQSYIIDNGGYIFFALYNGEVAGTVALINEEEGFELSKMAVDPKFQGLKIGQLLMQYCIHFARRKGWKELLLYSNTLLENAIYIYKKYGFKEVALQEDCPYDRSNIKMVLKL
jgi:DNA-binding MarR family transcriptional regulator/GNAT superfamily N-acetyltransferase